MKIKDLQRRFPELEATIEDRDFNPLSAFESFYFGKKTAMRYEKKAVERVVKEKVSFHSTCNSIFLIIKTYVKISCPSCGKEMTTNSAGGNSEQYTVNFRCECGVRVDISCPTDGFSVRFGE